MGWANGSRSDPGLDRTQRTARLNWGKFAAFTQLGAPPPTYPGNMLNPLWRTHSCVPRRHSCRRPVGLFAMAERNVYHPVPLPLVAAQNRRSTFTVTYGVPLGAAA